MLPPVPSVKLRTVGKPLRKARYWIVKEGLPLPWERDTGLSRALPPFLVLASEPSHIRLLN